MKHVNGSLHDQQIKSMKVLLADAQAREQKLIDEIAKMRVEIIQKKARETEHAKIVATVPVDVKSD